MTQDAWTSPAASAAPQVEGRYRPAAIVLHWGAALLIFAAIGVALSIDDLPKTLEDAAVNLHALFGLGVLALTLARLPLRRKAPAPLPADPRLMRLAQIVHRALYALCLLVPALGLTALLSGGRGLDFGLFKLASPFAEHRELAETIGGLHEAAAFGLIGLIGLHVAAALVHHFIWRDGMLSRMSFSRKADVQ